MPSRHWLNLQLLSSLSEILVGDTLLQKGHGGAMPMKGVKLGYPKGLGFSPVHNFKFMIKKCPGPHRPGVSTNIFFGAVALCRDYCPYSELLNSSNMFSNTALIFGPYRVYPS